MRASGVSSAAVSLWSDKLQAIEIFTPIDNKGGKFVGLRHETVFYDKDAPVDPVSASTRPGSGWGQDGVEPWRQCTLALFTDAEGNTTAVTPGTTIEYTVPDLSGRPWADIWEKYFEAGHEAS